jgi:predicted RNA-binding Zn ribbon-like protein
VGPADDGVGVDFDDGGDAVSDEEHAATRKTPATPMQAFATVARAAAAIRELNTRLVKTNSGGLATFPQ